MAIPFFLAMAMPISQWPCQLGNGHANGRRTRRTNNQSASASGVHRGCIGDVRIGGVSGVCRGYISFFLKVFLRFPCSPPGPPPLPFWLKLFGVKLFGVFRSQARPCSFSPSAAMDETGPQRARDAELLRLGELLALRMIAQEDQAKAGNQPGSHQWWEQPSLQSRAHVGPRERAKAANAPPPPKTNPLWDQPGPQNRAHGGARERAAAAGCGKATPYSDLPVPVKAPPPPEKRVDCGISHALGIAHAMDPENEPPQSKRRRHPNTDGSAAAASECATTKGIAANGSQPRHQAPVRRRATTGGHNSREPGGGRARTCSTSKHIGFVANFCVRFLYGVAIPFQVFSKVLFR